MPITGQCLENEQRIADLAETGLLEVKEDASFNRYARIASALLEVPIALVSLVTENRQHFIGSLGLPDDVAEAAETPLSHSFCKHVVLESEPLIIEDARTVPLVKDNLAVCDLGVIAYLGVPLITTKGNILGSFCAIDCKPKRWSDQDLAQMKDLGHLVTHEIELRRMGRKLKRTNEQLVAAEDKNDTMVQMILHDLRNPLFGIRGGISFLNDSTTLSTDDRMALEICDEASQQMERMLEQILQTHKLRTTDIQLNCQKIETTEFIETIVSHSSLAARANNITLTSDLHEAPSDLFGDTQILERVLQNLLINALKFTPKDGFVNLKISEAEDGMHLFQASDSGPGIDKDEAKVIFDQYVCGESGKKSTMASIGLGLAFCKAAVEAHGGHIWVESEKGHGSIFSFKLPSQ